MTAELTGLRGRFERFGDFGLREKRDVAGNFSSGANDQADRSGDFGEPVAVGVPGNRRMGQVEFLRERSNDCGSVGSENGERSHGTTELKGQCARAKLSETFAMASDGVEPACEFQAERDWTCLLKPRASGELRGGMLLGEFRETIGNFGQIGVKEIERVANLEHATGIDRVLTRSAEVDERGCVSIDSVDGLGE
jgi:hypothetical protein